jgi:hypothetical protein
MDSALADGMGGRRIASPSASSAPYQSAPSSAFNPDGLGILPHFPRSSAQGVPKKELPWIIDHSIADDRRRGTAPVFPPGLTPRWSSC